jgi:hypothetical protein
MKLSFSCPEFSGGFFGDTIRTFDLPNALAGLVELWNRLPTIPFQDLGRQRPTGLLC